MNILGLINNIRDPRMEGKVIHKFSSIIFVGLCAVLSGCENWSDVEDYCEAKKEGLSQYVDLIKGMPSEWTFTRVFTLLDLDHTEYLLRTHAATLVSQNKPSDQVSINEKALRSSKRKGLQCLHSLSAWCHENGLVLAGKQVDSKSNEITAIPLLLKSLALKGNTVSIDAVGCQKYIAKFINDKQGDYVQGLKRNHPRLYQEVENHIKEKGITAANQLYDAFEQGHGRLVCHRYFGFDATFLFQMQD